MPVARQGGEGGQDSFHGEKYSLGGRYFKMLKAMVIFDFLGRQTFLGRPLPSGALSPGYTLAHP